MAAHPKHDAVRGRYHGCCGYCGVSEEDAGGEFTVEHFVPIADGGDDQDDNLVYCCFRCNLYKSAFSPTDRDRAAGHVVLHPLRDDPTLHVRLDVSSGLLDALTETGRFHITLLHLNRPALVGHRLRRRRAELHAAKQQLLEAENLELHAIVAAQQRYIVRLRHLLDNEPPEH